MMVSDELNPYQQWLGVTESSPNYYELLGLADDIEDPCRIAAAADRAIARVRSHRPGAQAARWSQLLDELKRVKQILTDPQRKLEYDTTLGSARNQRNGKPQNSKPPKPRQGNAVFPKTPTPEGGRRVTDGAGLPPISLEGLTPPTTRPATSKNGSSPGEEGLSEAASTNSGIDLSYLRAPKEATPRKAPPRDQGPVDVPMEQLDQLDDIVLPPTLHTSSSKSPKSPDLALTPNEASNGPLIRANPALLAVKRRRQAGSASKGIVSGTMTLLLICLGVYIFLIFEEPQGDLPPGLAAPPSPTNSSMLSDAQKAAILEENEKREQGSGESEQVARDEVSGVSATSDHSPPEESLDSPARDRDGGTGDGRPASEIPAVTPPAGTDSPQLTDSARESSPAAGSAAEADAKSGKGESTKASEVQNASEGAARTSADSSGSVIVPESVVAGESADFDSARREVRVALTEHRLDDAVSAIARAQPLALLPEQEAQLLGLQQLTDLLREFRVAVERAMASMEAGTSFPISATHEVVVVERLPDAIRIRMAGENHLFPLTDLPLRLGTALAERGMPSGTQAKLVLGAFQWTHKRAIPQHRSQACEWWREAGKEGADVEYLLILADDSPR